MDGNNDYLEELQHHVDMRTKVSPEAETDHEDSIMSIGTLWQRANEIANAVGGGRELIRVEIESAWSVCLWFGMKGGEESVTFRCEPLDFVAPFDRFLKSIKNKDRQLKIDL